MKCRQAKDLIGAYLYGDLAPEEMRDLRVHTQECALCREDLASRGRIVSSLDDSVPVLSDEEKLRIAWSVKGAVRKEQLERKPIALRLLPALALAGVLVASVFAGGYLVTHRTPPAVEQTAEAPPEADVEIKELPATGNTAKSDQIANQISELLSSLMNPPAATIDRGSALSRRFERPTSIAPEVPVFAVPHQPVTPPAQQPPADLNSTDQPKDSAPVVENPETGADLESTQLPRVTDPKNAETTSSEDQ